jgi:hypothetical protein
MVSKLWRLIAVVLYALRKLDFEKVCDRELHFDRAGST